jgi:hypothetical protein
MVQQVGLFLVPYAKTGKAAHCFRGHGQSMAGCIYHRYWSASQGCSVKELVVWSNQRGFDKWVNNSRLQTHAWLFCIGVLAMLGSKDLEGVDAVTLLRELLLTVQTGVAMQTRTYEQQNSSRNTGRDQQQQQTKLVSATMPSLQCALDCPVCQQTFL